MEEIEKKERPTFITNTSVYGTSFNGSLGVNATKFRLNQIRGKTLSLGYWNDFTKEELGKFVDELYKVYERMEDSNDTQD
jgi:hypothetical protein